MRNTAPARGAGGLADLGGGFDRARARDVQPRDDPPHRRNGVRRRPRLAGAARGRPAGQVPRPRPAAGRAPGAAGLRGRRGRHDRCRESPPRGGGRRRRRPSRRDPSGQRRAVRADHDAWHAGPARRSARRGRRAFRAHERARRRRADEGPRAVLPREVGDGAGGAGLVAAVRDLPPELRVRLRRRHPPDVPAAREARARHADRRLGDAAAAADLGGRRPVARSSSAAPTSSTGTSSGGRSSRHSASAARASTCRCGSCARTRS